MAGKRSALIVATSEYKDSRLPPLPGPTEDAAALKAVLSNPAIGGYDVRVALNSRVETLRRTLDTFFAERARDDVLLLHFSGHGLKDDDGQLFLTGSDTRLDTGGVKVAVILPLSASGNAGLAAQSMRNAAEMALAEFQNPNIQLLIKDDAGSPQGAQAGAQQAVDEGAEIILGPLFAQSVPAVGAGRAHARHSGDRVLDRCQRRRRAAFIC